MEQEPLPVTTAQSPPHRRRSEPPPVPHAFYWGKEAQFLFSGWPGNNPGRYALALIFVFLLAAFAEVLSDLHLVGPGRNWVGAVFARAGILAIRAGFSYMVILAVMSYNGGVFIAAVLGHAVGYVIFGSGLNDGHGL